MIEEQFQKSWNNKYVFIAHMILNASFFLYGVTYLFDGNQTNMTKYSIFIGIICLYSILEIIAWKSEVFVLGDNIVGQIYYIIRPIVAIVFYYLASSKLEGNIFLVMLILGMEDLIFHTALAKAVKRIAIYASFFGAYGMVSIIMLVSLIQKKESRVTIEVGLREVATVLVVMLFVLLLGEAMAMLWGYFERQILKQNRALENLNEVNEELHEQQEKINQVNEKLGLQKIELQAANKRINRSHDELSVQNEISSAIASSVEKEVMLRQIANIMQIRLDMDVVAIILEEDNSLLVPGEKPAGRFVALSTSLGETFKNNLLDSVYKTDMKELLAMTQTYIQNSQTDSVKLFEYLTEEQELTSIICLPIMNQEERLGTLLVGKNRLNTFMDGRAFYENIASQLGIGVSNARLYAKMNDMAIRDGLTKVYNRRHLTHLFQQYLSEAITKKLPLSLALFDIDKFKMVNDTYGHQCGDEVIRYVATLLNKGALKHGGIAGRYGGEEFVVVFLGKNLEETYEIVKEIHQQIKSEEVVYGDKRIQVRASAGVASYPTTCSNPSELLTRADWAMYHSKKNGRDQITIDSDQIVDKM